MSAPTPEKQEYQVVARRYRPQVFTDLVGQEHVARALSSAIQNHRIGHAYLFTGARGVGKTSSARIFAKSLNCVHGPTPTPCNVCEICQGISVGEDIDVLEIDGASNRGIDEIRALRQNVNVRPTRARFKIYIIDEVHMLTREAFNALLKTLEEPPEHVKFIFCTTEPGKIPITILSRCQRFDFAGINTPEIATRLMEIVTAEGLTAEPEAIMLLARRAAGSMRDGQSLLEQLLSFAAGTITVQDVHQMLGTAGEDVLLDMLGNIVARNTAGVLSQVDALVQHGSDPGLILEQLFGYLRDAMALLCGCGPESLLFASGESEKRVREYAAALGMETILAAMQISDQTLGRLKLSTQARLLVEMALVRICALKDLDHLSEILVQFQEAAPQAKTASQMVTPPQATRPVLTETKESGKNTQNENSIREVPERKITESPYVPTRSFSQEVKQTDAEPSEKRADALNQEDAVKKNENSGHEARLSAPAGLPKAHVKEAREEDLPPDDVMAVLRDDYSPKNAKTDSPAVVYQDGLRRLGGRYFSDLGEFEAIHADTAAGTVTVSYPFTQNFAVNFLKMSESFQQLQKDISAQLGFSVKIIFAVAENPEIPPPAKENFAENIIHTPVDHPLVTALETFFGGTVVRAENIPPDAEN